MGYSLSDEMIYHLVQNVQGWAELLWKNTLCLRIKVDVITIDRPLQRDDFVQAPGFGYMLPPENVKPDLEQRGIGFPGLSGRGRRIYDFYIVNFTGDPSLFGASWGARPSELFGTPFMYQSHHVKEIGKGVDAFLHESLHGIENNMWRSDGPLWDRRATHANFPYTHPDGAFWEVGTALRNGNGNRYLETEIDPYLLWILDTCPTSYWLDLEVVSQLRTGTFSIHLSDDLPDPTGAIYDWLLAGPFLDETPDMDGKDIVRCGDSIGGKTWIAHHGEPRSIVVTPKRVERVGVAHQDVLEHGKREKGAVAFAATYLVSPDHRQVFLEVGSTETIVVYLNGQLVDRANGQKLLTLFLQEGANLLVLKIRNRENLLGFCARLVNRSGAPLPDVRVALAP